MELAVRTMDVLGSVAEIKLPAPHAPLFSSCFTELERIEQAFSRFLPASELSQLNARLGEWQDASPELLVLVAHAEQIRQQTDGNFDIALQSVLEELGYGPKKESKGPAPVRASFPFLAAPRPQINLSRGQIKLSQPIEFGGLGKGYALDCVASLLEKAGVAHYYLNAGGDIYAKKGPGPEYAPWKILLEHPDDPQRAIGEVELDGRAIAGSAPNRRKWGQADECHHLINAKTKIPAQGTKAVFVLAKSGLEADAYATALFTAGFEEGILLAQHLPVGLLSVSSQNKLYQSPGFDAKIYA